MITVFGASGHTGGTAASYLLKAGKKVRVVGRHADKLARFTQAGAESAVGDIEDATFIRKALAGAEAAYVLIPPNLTTDDFRAYQRRIVDGYADGIEAVGTRHVVLLSSIGAHHREGTGPIVAVHDFEERLKKIANLNALFLRAGYFMENVLAGMAQVKAQGVYAGTLPADASVAMVASSDIGDHVGSRLDRLDFTGKSAVHFIGPKAVSQTEWVGILSKTLGKPVRYQQISFDDMAKVMRQAGISPSAVDVLMEMNRGAAKGLVAPEEGGTVVHAQTPFETFARLALK